MPSSDRATRLLYTPSLHDALPILAVPLAMHLKVPKVLKGAQQRAVRLIQCDIFNPVAQTADRLGVELIKGIGFEFRSRHGRPGFADRKSTRLNSSHTVSSYAVF